MSEVSMTKRDLVIVDGLQKMAGMSEEEGAVAVAGGDEAMVLDRLDENHAVSLQQEGEH